MYIIANLTLTALLINGVASSAEAGRGKDAVGDYVVYPVPDAVEDSPYALSIGGKTIPIERAGSIQPAYYARLYLAKPARVTLSVKATGRVVIDLKPERICENVESGVGDISLDVAKAGPRVFTCSVDGRELPPFFLLVEQYDFEALRPDVNGLVDISDYCLTSECLQTEKIQKALDDVAAKPGGGTLYFGPGVYHTGTIRVGSNTSVYLAPGALIQGSNDIEDYPDHPNGRQLILFEDCSNSSLRGYGVIDGSGSALQSVHDKKAHLLDVVNCKNLSFEGVTLRNAGAWTFHMLGCDRVCVDNFKIINDWTTANTDGIDIDCSTDINVTRYFGYCGDDAVVIKTTGRAGVLKPSRNVRITDSVVLTRKTALKLGTESRDDMSDVVFENIDVIASARGVGLWCSDGHKFSDITFRDIRMDLREIEGEDMSGEPYRVVISNRDGIGRVENIVFDRITTHAPYRSLFFGHPESYLNNITVKDCSWTITSRQMKDDKCPAVELWNCRNMTLENVQITWLDQQRAKWTSFIGQANTDNVLIRNSVELHR